jgi:hypothetical protein
MLGGISMKAIKLMIIVLFAFGLFFLPTISGVNAKVKETIKDDSFCGDEGFNCECQNFYNSTDYVAVEKWAYDGEKDYVLKEEKILYNYFNIHVTGDLKEADWTSSPEIYSVLVKAGNERVEFDGGLSGSVDSIKDISHVTFCKYNDGSNGGCTGANCGSNGVPEFPAFSIGAAVLVVTLGLVFLRKN